MLLCGQSVRRRAHFDVGKILLAHFECRLHTVTDIDRLLRLTAWHVQTVAGQHDVTARERFVEIHCYFLLVLTVDLSDRVCNTAKPTGVVAPNAVLVKPQVNRSTRSYGPRRRRGQTTAHLAVVDKGTVDAGPALPFEAYIGVHRHFCLLV